MTQIHFTSVIKTLLIFILLQCTPLFSIHHESAENFPYDALNRAAACLCSLAGPAEAYADPARVICVPHVPSDLRVPHETWSGEPTILKGIARGVTAGTYYWEYGDGVVSESLPVSNPDNLSVTYTYDAPEGTLFIARLHVINTADEEATDEYRILVKAKTLDVEINKAIDDGLWWLFTHRSGSGDYSIIPASVFTAPDGQQGLLGQYFNNTSLSGDPALERIDPEINFNWGNGSPGEGINADFSVRWTGTLNIPQAGYYNFASNNDDGTRLYIDGFHIIDDWRSHAPAWIYAAPIYLTAGPHTFQVDFYDGCCGAQARIYWVADDMVRWQNLSDNNSYASYSGNPTASAVQAFEINGHLQTGDFEKDPYVPAVKGGISHLLSHLSSTNLTMQGTNDPDSNGNGIGLSWSLDNRPIYELGAIMDAIVATGTPDAVAEVGGTNVQGRRYQDIVQDMVDMYAWGQDDAGNDRGGWRYSWNGGSDNSAAQWGAIGMIAAERHFGCTVPEWVKELNRLWLNYSYNSAGFFGYTGSGANRSGYATGPSGMVQMAFDGLDITDPRWQDCESYIDSHWQDFLGWNSDSNNQTRDCRHYSYYAFAKAMRLAKPSEVIYLPSGLNWYGDEEYGLAKILVDSQNADGSWPYDGWPYVGQRTAAAWNIIILTRTLFEKPPVAVIKAEPNPGAVGQTITFDASGSYHTDPAKEIVQYLWDFDASDGVDFEHPDATGISAVHAYGLLQDYTVSLKVIDNSTPVRFDVSTYTMHITIPPHPPTAVIGGPYIAATGEEVQVDGSGSYDIDEPQGDSITAWDWESNMIPPYGYDEAHGETALLPPFALPGHYDIILRVTDNTATVFPSSNQPDLTDTAYGEVTVYAQGISDLTARPKDAKCQLTWTPTSAEAYRILRSEKGPNQGFVQIGTTTSDYSLFIDHNLSDTPGEVVNACRGDLNSDYVVDNADATIFAEELGSSDCSDASPCRGDFDNDGDVDGMDNAFFMAEMGRTECRQVTGLELDRDYWYRILTEVDGATRISNPVHVNSQGKIDDHPPVITSQPVGDAQESEAYEYDVDAYDPEGTSLEYILDMAPAGMQINSSSGIITWVPARDQAGIQEVMVRVQDGAGISATQYFQIVVQPRANTGPEVNPGGPYSALTGESVTFSGNATDPEGDPIVSWHWVMGDGSEADGQQVTHTYAASGTFTVTLYVTDDRGATGRAETHCDVTMPNRQPTADTGGPYDGFAGTALTLDCSASYDPDGDNLTCTWNFGDGTPVQTGTQVTHTFDSEGTYTVSLQVEDGRGGSDSSTTEARISPPNQPPEASFTVEGNTIRYATLTFDAAESNDPDGHQITKWEWDFGDGMSTTGTIVTHAYADSGSYSITLRVTDQYGATGTATRELTIEPAGPNHDPVIDAGGPYSGQIATPVTLSAEAGDPDFDSLSFEWNYDGNSYQGQTVQITFNEPGDYTVSLTVDDGHGGSAQDTALISIYDPDAPIDTNPPSVKIISPDSGSQLTGSIEITGTVVDENLKQWVLEYAPSGTEQWKELSTGTETITNGILASIDTCLMPDDFYVFRLRASDNRQESSTWNEYHINCPVRLGQFSLRYTDMTIPAMGFPIEVKRKYSSFSSGGTDFGPGWELELTTANIREDVNHSVYITLPDGRRTAFMFTPVRLSIWFPFYEARFTAAPGVYDKLDFEGNHMVVRSGDDWYYFMDSAGKFNPDTYILKTKKGYTYTISQADGVQKIEDRNGNHITIQPDGIFHSSGRNVLFERDGSGRITDISDPAGNSVHYTYDSLGRLVEFIDQEQNISTYSYESDSSRIIAFNPAGGCGPEIVNYFPDGRMMSRINAARQETSYSYDTDAHSETVTNPLGHDTTYQYDANGNVLSVHDTLGLVTRYEYDSANNLITEILPSDQIVRFTYDDRGNRLTEIRYPEQDHPLVTTYTYNAYNQLTSLERPEGDKISYSYDENGNLLKREYSDAENNSVSVEQFEYDQAGNRIIWTDAMGHTIHYAYDNYGDPISITNPLDQTVLLQYDSNGNLASFTDAEGKSIVFKYDKLNRMIQAIQNGITIAKYEYGGPGTAILSATDADGNRTEYEYDCLEMPVSATDALGNLFEYQRDQMGNLTAITDPADHSTVFVYDAMNRQTERTGPDGNAWTFQYHDNVHTSPVSSPMGLAYSRTYDGTGRPVSITTPDRTATISYDDDSRIILSEEETTTGTQRTTAYTHSILTGADGVQHQETVTANGRTIEYRYNGNGHRTLMITPDGMETTYQYDSLGRIQEISTDGDWIRYSYTAANKVSARDYSNGVHSEYTYDEFDRLESISIYDSDNVLIEQLSYSRTSAGWITDITMKDGEASYSVDELYRLTSETVTSASLGNFSHNFSYDVAGNLLLNEAEYGPDNRLLSTGGMDYEYDLNGNLIHRGNESFGYDSLNRLVAYSNLATGINATYEYDLQGRRILKRVGTDTREYLYDDETVVSEYLNGILAARYTYTPGYDELIMSRMSGHTYFYHTDASGNIIAITDEDGHVVQRYGYDAWGNILYSNGSFSFGGTGLVNTFTFTGREYDNESGLYYFRARTYDPSIGRFLQKDPLQGNLKLPQTLNLYAYALNNPVSITDPSGQQVLIEYAGLMSKSAINVGMPSHNDIAAAIAGFAHGFSCTNLMFLASFMEVAFNDYDIQSKWDHAIELTEQKLNRVKSALGLSSDTLGGINSPMQLYGIPGSFKSGASIKVGFSVKLIDKNGEEKDSPYTLGIGAGNLGAKADFTGGTFEVQVTPSGGGFENGTAQALSYIRGLRPH